MAVNRGGGHGKATKWIETGYSLYSRRGHWRTSPDKLIPAMKKAGANIDWLDEQVWRNVAIPRLGFYVPAALDPAPNLFAAIFAVVCRFGGVAFFIHHRRSHIAFGQFDLAFGYPVEASLRRPLR
jgi:hypothetical protein